MKAIIATLSLLALSTPAMAQAGRPNLHTMTCGAAASFVKGKGAVVANTSPNAYQRLVANGSYCQHGETAEPYFSSSTDQRQCLVGYECRDLTQWNDNK